MLRSVDELVIDVVTQYGKTRLVIVPERSGDDQLFIDEFCEADYAKYQLVENCNYQYEFEPIGERFFQFSEENRIVRHSSFAHHCNMGTMKTGSYVGQLSLKVQEVGAKNSEDGVVRLEVRSVKANYETDYRIMLDEIAAYYTDLILTQTPLVCQQLEVEELADSQTLYQRFSFVRSVIENNQFQEAMNRIMSVPVKRWSGAQKGRNAIGRFRLKRKNLNEFASSRNRMPIPEGKTTLPPYLKSIPKTMETDVYEDDVDNNENRFVKFVLSTFASFCSSLSEMPKATARLKEEAAATRNTIDEYLDSTFFQSVSAPFNINLNNPVLLRKEGYREVLQAWLMFDLAARLNWKGGDNVYEAGKKNVAVLYEYWVFFKLQELVCEFFQIEQTRKSELVKTDENGITLMIEQGRKIVLEGRCESFIRPLNVALYYNRTFDSVESESFDSWTIPMRPDYTLSIWPGNISEKEAELENLVTLIHFDAKYRLRNISAFFGNNISSKGMEETTFLHPDIVKMHSYKDAIRHTGGAYLIYPGTEGKTYRGFHEVLPGLGAFCIRPGHWAEDIVPMKTFLSEVKNHMMDRLSRREKLLYCQYDIYKNPIRKHLMACLPELVGANRNFFPDEIAVIVGKFSTTEHLNWIFHTNMFEVCLDVVSLSKDLVGARYLLLHDGARVLPLVRLFAEEPKVYTTSQLAAMGYPKRCEEENESNKLYLVFSIAPNSLMDKELLDFKWETLDLPLEDSRLSVMRLSDVLLCGEKNRT